MSGRLSNFSMVFIIAIIVAMLLYAGYVLFYTDQI